VEAAAQLPQLTQLHLAAHDGLPSLLCLTALSQLRRLGVRADYLSAVVAVPAPNQFPCLESFSYGCTHRVSAATSAKVVLGVLGWCTGCGLTVFPAHTCSCNILGTAPCCPPARPPACLTVA
jgi:hypothetical protein